MARAAGDQLPEAPLPPNQEAASTIDKLLEEGNRFLQDRDYHQAIGCFERAYSLKPASPQVRQSLARAHSGLGVEFTNSGEPGQARQSFERALRFDEDQLARFGLGYLDFLDQKDGSARDNLHRSLSLKANDSAAYKLLALIDYRRGETSTALQLIERAVKLDSRDPEAEAFRKRWMVEERLSGRLETSSTRHFLVKYDKVIHPEAMREILNTLEGIYESIGESLGHWPRKQIPVRLYSKEDFYRATGSFHWVGGVFDGQIKIPVNPEEGRPGARRHTLIRTLRHEYTHAVVKELSPACPNWLNEGIAQYFEYPEEAGEDRSRRDQRMTKQLIENRQRKIPLERVPPRMWEISDQSFARLTYLEGLGFVSYLIEKHRAFRLRILLSTYRREGSLNRAFKITYGATLQELEDRWWKSVEKSRN